MNDALYGNDAEYYSILGDPVSKALAEVRFNTRGTHNLLEKMRQRTEPPQAFYDDAEFVEFGELMELKTNYDYQKKLAVDLGYEVLNQIGYQTWWDEGKSRREKEDITIYCMRDTETKYEIHFTFELNNETTLATTSKNVIHIMLILAPKANQGHFFRMAKLLKDFKRCFLDGGGMSFGYGRCVPDNQWGVKEKPNGNKNWRKDVKQIKCYASGKTTKNAGNKLMASYLRLGFLWTAEEEEEHPTIYYLSNNFKEEFSKDPKNKEWLKERLKYSKYEK